MKAIAKPRYSTFVYGCFIAGIMLLIFLVALVIVYNMKPVKCPNGFVCTPKGATSSPQIQMQAMSAMPMPPRTSYSTTERDMRVLDDPLYPPLNRTDRVTYDGVVRQSDARNFNVPTQGSGDSYRLVGYLINSSDDTKDSGGNSWKLMARQKDRNEADFYIIPTNKDFDVKVPLTPEVFAGGSRFKSVDTVPMEVQLVSPLLSKTPYTFVELPKGSFSDGYN